MFAFLFVVICVVGSSEGGSGPVWPKYFSIEYDETLELYSPESKTTWKSAFWYDSEQKMSRTDSFDGQNDPFCQGDVKDPMECIQLVRDNGWRYIIYPSIDGCCKCCNATMGCGILALDWMVDGGYIGTRKFGDKVCKGWLKSGHASNYYYVQEGKPYDIPCGLQMNATDNCETYVYDTTYYKPGPVDPAVFDLPEGCGDEQNIRYCSGFCSYFR